MDKTQKLFAEKLQVVNIGLERFHEAVVKQETTSIHVEWRPPAGGKERLSEILDKLNKI